MKPGGVAGFVARIADRYRLRGGAIGALAMPLASLLSRVEGNAGPVHNALHLVLRPRLQLSVTNQFTREHPAPSGLPQVPAPLRTAASLPIERRAHTAASAIVARLRRRESRTESVPQRPDTARPATPGAIAPALPPPALPMVTRRPPERAPATPDAERAPPPRRAEPQAPAAPPTIPPAEIARITDQVMHTLNRRIAAERERVGRR